MMNGSISRRRQTARVAGALLLILFSVAVNAAEDEIHTLFQAEEFGYRLADENSFKWDVQGWIGGDFNKFWFKSEGERFNGSGFEEAELQLLYSRLISDFWDLQVGLRHDFQPEPERSYVVLGFQGLAPYRFDVDASAFISNQGDVSARFKAEYDLLLTQKLVLSPSLELNLAAQTDRKRGIGDGVNDLELSLSLRYEVIREFAPYIGVVWQRKYGQTADFARAEGEDVERTAVMAGIRFWF